jgi:glycosyltransferase involved in cell wall biosynthesis
MRMNSNLKQKSASKSISIMGIRGLPAQHGGFETFAERLAPYLLAAGWDVTVYCQEDERMAIRESTWNGIRRVHVGVGSDTAVNTIRFDWACISHALRDRPSVVLTLGYNTAAFCLRLRAAGIPNVMNMDGIEWMRQKWGWAARTWLYANDWAGCLGATHLVADHPEIARHLESRVAARKITIIPYGATLPADAGREALAGLDLARTDFLTVIARPEPENSILEIVQAFSARPRGCRLVVLGKFMPDRMPYHAAVMAAASEEVMFPGAIYDPAIVHALRIHSLLYVHGHRVGGTNPSLLEAMGAGNAVLAHDNPFNRWVAGEGAEYFDDTRSCGDALDRLLGDASRRAAMSRRSLDRVLDTFAWSDVLSAYESLLDDVRVWAHGHPSWPRHALSSAPHGQPHGQEGEISR